MQEYCIVTWRGIGKSLDVLGKISDFAVATKTLNSFLAGTEEKQITKKTKLGNIVAVMRRKNVNVFLEDLITVLNTSSQARSWRLKASLGEKGVFKFIMFKPKNSQKSYNHLLLYWEGNRSRVEMCPHISAVSEPVTSYLSGATLGKISECHIMLPSQRRTHVFLDNMAQITAFLSTLKWKLRSVASTKGNSIWIFAKRIRTTE